jgi:predicted nucleotidyltransferase
MAFGLSAIVRLDMAVPMSTANTYDSAVLDEAVQRIVRSVRPRRIILFGSAARGDMGPDSDIDLLVVVRDGVHRRRTAQTLYRSLMGLGFATELVIATEGDLRDFGDEASFVFRAALHEGRELYHAVA